MVTNCSTDQGASFFDHVVQGEAPDIYAYLWTVAGIFILATCGVLLSPLRTLYRQSMEERQGKDMSLPPTSYFFRLSLCALPIWLSVLDVVTLLSPRSVFSTDVLIELSIGTAFCAYGALVAKMCGGLSSMGRRSDIVATGPAGCMSLHLSHLVCARITFAIAQSAVVLPVCALAVSEYGYHGENASVSVRNSYLIVGLISTLTAVVGMMWLTRFASYLLPSESPLWEMFLSMKGVILATKVPPALVLAVSKHVSDKGPKYPSDVISHAIMATVSIVLMTLIAVRCRNTFALPRPCERDDEKNLISANNLM